MNNIAKNFFPVTYALKQVEVDLETKKLTYELVMRNLNLVIVQLATGYEDLAYDLLKKTVAVIDEEKVAKPSTKVGGEWEREQARKIGEEVIRIAHKLGVNEIDLAGELGDLAQLNKEVARHKLIDTVTEACLNRTKPVVNLDDTTENCGICGYDHSLKTEWNEKAYKLAHLAKDLNKQVTGLMWDEPLSFDEYNQKTRGDYATYKSYKSRIETHNSTLSEVLVILNSMEGK